MAERKQWRLMCWAVRLGSCLVTVAVVTLALFWALERGLSSVYGDTGLVRHMGRQLALSLLILLAVAALTTKRVMNTESWREALSWTAALVWQGVKLGLAAFVLIAMAGLIVTRLLIGPS